MSNHPQTKSAGLCSSPGHRHRTRQMLGSPAHPETLALTPPLGLGQWFSKWHLGTPGLKSPKGTCFSLKIKKGERTRQTITWDFQEKGTSSPRLFLLASRCFPGRVTSNPPPPHGTLPRPRHLGGEFFSTSSSLGVGGRAGRSWRCSNPINHQMRGLKRVSSSVPNYTLPTEEGQLLSPKAYTEQADP